MLLQRLRDWFLFGKAKAADGRTEIISSRILPEGATLITTGPAARDLGAVHASLRGEVDSHLDYIVHNPALNDGPAAHHKAPVVHKYAGSHLYCYIWALSDSLIRCYGRLMSEPERVALRSAGRFSVLLLRVIPVPEPDEVRAAMDGFPRETREVVRMRFLEDMAADAIGAALGASTLAVRRMIVRALETLGEGAAERPGLRKALPLDAWRLDTMDL